MNRWMDFIEEEDGAGTVEVVLLIVVIIGLVILFKGKMTTLITNIFKTITTRSGTV